MALARLTLLLALAMGVGAAPSSAAVTGACHVSPVVADLERSLRFYRDVLGLETSAAPTAGPIPWQANQGLLDVHGLRNARMRSVELRIPGTRCGVELVEFDAPDRRPVRLRVQDPGAVTLIVLVRDLDAAVARLQAAKVQVLSTGGAPVLPSQTSKTRAIIVSDPDGHIVELAQLVPQPAAAVSATSNVFDLRFRITVRDMERSVAAYRDQLGMVITPGVLQSGPGVMAMMGLPDTVRYAVTMTPIPGSTLIHEFLALEGIEGKPSPARVHDPGAYRLELLVDDLDRVLAQLKTAGIRVVSTGGTSVELPSGRAVAVQDLNNLVLILRQVAR